MSSTSTPKAELDDQADLPGRRDTADWRPRTTWITLDAGCRARRATRPGSISLTATLPAQSAPLVWRVVASSVFTFPNPVNDYAARSTAGLVVIFAVVTIVVDHPVLYALLALGFLLRVLSGPTLSPFGRTLGSGDRPQDLAQDPESGCRPRGDSPRPSDSPSRLALILSLVGAGVALRSSSGSSWWPPPSKRCSGSTSAAPFSGLSSSARRHPRIGLPQGASNISLAQRGAALIRQSGQSSSRPGRCRQGCHVR